LMLVVVRLLLIEQEPRTLLLLMLEEDTLLHLEEEGRISWKGSETLLQPTKYLRV